jgi:putative nucleotidyltransferase with HDIG domain
MTAREVIASHLPEMEQIADPDMKEKAYAAWELVMTEGGWSPEDLDRVPFTLLIDPCPATLMKHTAAVTRTALAICDTLSTEYGHLYKLDRQLVLVGALLHDVGKLLEYKKTGDKFVKSDNGKLLRHPFSGAAVATRVGLPDAVVHIIATHAHEGDGGYRTPESVVVHHSDFANFEPLRDLAKG